MRHLGIPVLLVHESYLEIWGCTKRRIILPSWGKRWRCHWKHHRKRKLCLADLGRGQMDEQSGRGDNTNKDIGARTVCWRMESSNCIGKMDELENVGWDHILRNLFILIFWPCHMACWILVLQRRIELVLPALEVWHLNHQTTREVWEIFYVMKKTVEYGGSRGYLSGRAVRSYLSHWNEEGRLNGRKPDHSKKPGGSYCNNPGMK